VSLPPLTRISCPRQLFIQYGQRGLIGIGIALLRHLCAVFFQPGVRSHPSAYQLPFAAATDLLRAHAYDATNPRKQNAYETTTVAVKYGACLLPTTCMGLGANILSQFESSGAGLKLNALNESPSDDGFSMASIFMMLAADTALCVFDPTRPTRNQHGNLPTMF